jgi:hypothetical protein
LSYNSETNKTKEKREKRKREIEEKKREPRETAGRDDGPSKSKPHSQTFKGW